MSRIQTHLRSLPEGSCLTSRMFDDVRAVNSELDRERAGEVASARAVMLETGCAWPQALRAVLEGRVAAAPK